MLKTSSVFLSRLIGVRNIREICYKYGICTRRHQFLSRLIGVRNERELFDV